MKWQDDLLARRESVAVIRYFLHEPLRQAAYECVSCGAVVHNMDRHDKWHQEHP